MAAIVTAIYKTTPAGVFAVCPFLLCCSLVCPIRTPDGRTIPPYLMPGVSLLGDRRGGYLHTRGNFSVMLKALRIMRGACVGGARAHRAEVPRLRGAACAQATAEKPLTPSK